MPDLLIELFSEEIPARMQRRAAEDLKKLVTNGLVEAGLTYAGAGAFSTPRRLALAVEGLSAQSPTVTEERKGPRTDAPEKALEGFLRSTGLARDQLTARADKKGEVWFAEITRPGRPAAEIAAEVITGAIQNFPWPKSMRWGAGTLRWVRPLHSILAILSDEGGAETLAIEIEGIRAGAQTQGHRFMAPDCFAVTGFDDYQTRLKRAKVILDSAEREEAIWNEASNLAFAQGLEVVEDKGLLAEVAGLVEWPVTLMGKIDAAYLDLPAEVLQTSMREHQKFFSVRNPKTGGIEQFITVANRETADHGATILAGNARVLSARLADAKFFWENDLRIAKGQKMRPWLDALEKVTFHNKLGSQADRIERIAALAGELAEAAGADAEQSVTAARVAKADLSSEMVYEFPELQGVMGRYYALEAGYPQAVADAARDHYSPLGPSDDVPADPVSVAVALADKLDTLTGFWAIDEKPTGSKDPFALRRAALGVIRLVLDNDLRVSLSSQVTGALATLLEFGAFQSFLNDFGEADYKDWVRDDRFSSRFNSIGYNQAVGQFFERILVDATKEKSDFGVVYRAAKRRVSDSAADLLGFFHDRLKVYLRDQGLRHDVIDACIAMPGNDDLTLLVKRAAALSETLKTDDGENLIQGFKRANNILSQAEEKDGVEYSYGADVKFAETDVERRLFGALDKAEGVIDPAMKAEDFAVAMAAMADLRGPIDAFFEAVQINAESEVLRRNRLNLLSRIRTVCLSVADLTRLEG